MFDGPDWPASHAATRQAEAIRTAIFAVQFAKRMGVVRLSGGGCASHRTATAGVARRTRKSEACRGRLRIFETNHGIGGFDGNGIEFATKLFRQLIIRSVFIAKEIWLGVMLAVLAARRTTVSVL
jgi:hypothetical protein